MWENGAGAAQPLSHEMPCVLCGHGPHSFLPCSDSCDCASPVTATLPSGRFALAPA